MGLIEGRERGAMPDSEALGRGTQEPPRFLLVEDNPGDVRLVQEYLAEDESRPFQVEQASTLAEAVARVRDEPFDLVLLDLGLPDSRGLKTLDTMAAAAADLPIVVLTGATDEELALKAVNAGAQDYLVKGSGDDTAIRRVVHYAMQRKRHEVELRAARDRAEQALDQLRAAQESLVEAEKMAALGRLVAGIAHEINTPIGNAVTVASTLRGRTADIREKSTAGIMTRADFNSYLDTAEETSGLLLSNMERAAELVKSITQVDADQTRL